MSLLQGIVSQEGASPCVFAKVKAEAGIPRRRAPGEGRQRNMSAIFRRGLFIFEYFLPKALQRVNVSRNGEGVCWGFGALKKVREDSNGRRGIEQLARKEKRSAG